MFNGTNLYGSMTSVIFSGNLNAFFFLTTGIFRYERSNGLGGNHFLDNGEFHVDVSTRSLSLGRAVLLRALGGDVLIRDLESDMLRADALPSDLVGNLPRGKG